MSTPVGTAQHTAPTSGSRLDRWWAARSRRTRLLIRWGAPALVVLLAAAARLWNLGQPASLVFDETFYAKDAWTLLQNGYESTWPAGADEAFNAGQTDGFTSDPSFVVHPPLGKWIIALGMLAFGPTPFGWRIAVAVVGILAVVLLMLIAKRLTGSQSLATIAGFLFAIEGNAIVMSRVALLDTMVMFFALLGAGAVLLDREQSATRLALWAARRRTGWGPALWFRPWLLAAGAAFGAATAVKWNGLYFLAGFAVYTLVVDAVARRRAGIPFWLSGTILKQGPVSFLLTVPVALGVYLLSWSSWFASDNGYSRQWAAQPGNAWTGPLAWVPLALQSLLRFQVSVYEYNVGESRPHPYQANPLGWLLMLRPTGMYYQSVDASTPGCPNTCGENISGLPNPIIWYAAVAAALYLVYRLIRRREWRVGFALMGLAAGYLPWLLYLNRTVFQFYTIAFEPFLILALTLVIGMLLGTRSDPAWRRTNGLSTVAVFLAVCLLVSVYFYPMWTGIRADFWFIASHWWLPSWR